MSTSTEASVSEPSAVREENPELKESKPFIEGLNTKGFSPALVRRLEDDEEQVEFIPSTGGDLFVSARNPEEMAHSQMELIRWVDTKLERLKASLKTDEDNLAAAVSAKIRTAQWKSAVRNWKREIKLYTKVRGALAEGYFIVPDFPVTVIAVRTMETHASSGATSNWRGHVDQERHQGLPIGEGHYVSPVPKVVKDQEPSIKSDGTPEVDSKGKQVYRTVYSGGELLEVSLPFRIVRPHIIKDLSKAMQSKVFDTIGVLPTQRGPDPMLIGRIELRDGKYRVKKRVSFLISWWLSTHDL
jgi:hypothetical protein